jgi:hypothetical protein
VDRPTKLAFIDTETTGLNHLSRPWEIAVILRETEYVDTPELSSAEPKRIPAKITQREHLFQVEYQPRTLPDGTEQEALIVSRWHERGWGAPGDAYRGELIDQGVLTALGPEWTVARKVHELLQGATLVGIGVHYDAEVLGRMFLRHGLPWQPWHYAIVDLKTAAWGHLRGRRGRTRKGATDAEETFRNELIDSYDQVPVSSERMGEWLGVASPADEDRHTALGDARWAYRWWEELNR